MEWLKQILQLITDLIPRIGLVNPDESGIRITLGYIIKPTSPGWYVYWPVIQSWQKITITTQIKDIREQSLTTRDGKNVIVGGAVQYKITDARKALLSVMDYDSALQTLVIGIISTYIGNRDYEGCRDINTLEELLLKGTREVASGFGLKIMRVFITDFCKAETYRIVGIISPIRNMTEIAE